MRRLIPVIEHEYLAIYCTSTWRWLWDDGANSLPNLLKSFLCLVEPPDCLEILPSFSQTPEEERLLHSIAMRIRLYARISTKGASRDGQSRERLRSETGIFMVFAKKSGPNEISRMLPTSNWDSQSESEALKEFLILDDYAQRAILILLIEPSTRGLQLVDGCLADLR